MANLTQTFDWAYETSVVPIKVKDKNIDKDLARIFSVGPYGDKINFFFQQSKAFTLIEALEERFLKKDDSTKSPLSENRILIVGAGLAGLTVATALHSKGNKPKIFEKRGSILSKQQQSTNRFLHPSMNFWPNVSSLHGPTTALPHMNWASQSASGVIDIIRKKWTAIDLKPDTFVEVVKLKHTNDFVEVTYKLEGEETTKTDEYDAVICCTGFGEDLAEQEFDQNNYWKRSIKEDRKIEKAIQLGEKIGISGIGDGGLIDALETIYDCEYPGQKIIELFADNKNITLVQSLVEKAESESDPRKKIKFYNQAQQHLHSNSENDLKVLYQKMKNAGAKLVLLCYNEDHPVNGNAAPFHKLLLTHAINSNVVEVKNITEKITKQNFGDIKALYELSELYISHGGSIPILSIIEDFDQSQLKTMQERLVGTNLYDEVKQLPYTDPNIVADTYRFLVEHLGFDESTDTRSYDINKNNKVISIDPNYISTRSLPKKMGCQQSNLVGYEIFGFELKEANKPLKVQEQ